jgi:superfamily II DNA or RNA helicase
MSLKDLITDESSSIDDEIARSVDARSFSTAVGALARFEFWSPATTRRKSLWTHQRKAIETVAAYLAADPHLPERPKVREAALLKLPTGTGKSGIVAVLARCLPAVKRVLVLTPRQSLVEQMNDDVRFRFWKHLGYDTVEGKTFVASAPDLGGELAPVYSETLLPSRSDSILHHASAADRVFLAGTYQALDLVRRRSRDMRPDRETKRKQALALLQLLVSFDLVLVDEGHYEPAISWSKAVRELNRPTVLLSATPYRNDFKSFRVRGRFVYNYPHADAIRQRIIRDVEIAPAARGRGSAAQKFVAGMAYVLPSMLGRAAAWTKTPKVMVRGDDLDTLVDLQVLIDKTFGTNSVLVHDRAEPTRKYPRRYQSVRRAFRECADARFWIHQFKLMEGVDDPDFVVAAVFDLPTNGRQLVQQIGRIVRTSRGVSRKQMAFVLATPENVGRIEATWTRYQEYEVYCSKETRHIVVNEIALPDRVLAVMPQNQYIGGDFRRRFDPEAALSAEDVQLSTSAAVYRWTEPSRSMSEIAEAAEDALMEEDRFRIVPLGNLPSNAIGFSYYSWRNSPLLIDTFFSEWRLGLFVAVRHGDLIMMQDTEGIVIEPEAIGMEPAPRAFLERAFAKNARSSRLTRMSFGSLDMSERAIRTLAMRTRSFETTFTDLLDPNLVPTAASGFVAGKARYIGFAKARLRDASERRVPMKDFLKWTAAVAKELASKTLIRSDVFDRYASIRDDITPAGATPLSILLNLSRDELSEGMDGDSEAKRLAADPSIDHDDLCADVDAEGKFMVAVLGKPMECKVTYNSESGRYRFHSHALNEMFRQREIGDRAHAPTASQRIAADQSFRILVSEPGVVYAERRFFEPRIDYLLPNGEMPLLDDVHAVAKLGGALSEKGERFFADRERWHAESLFGAVEDICVAGDRRQVTRRWGEFGQRLAAYPLVVCDDDSTEIGDFIGVDPVRRRVVFIHAKANSKGSRSYNVDALQAVGRQATASLTFLTRAPPTGNWRPERWTSDVQANAVELTGRNRIFKNDDRLAPDAIGDALRSACANAAYEREVWIVGGGMVDRAAIADLIEAGAIDNRLRQFLMQWDGLRTACARAGARLRLFCH